MKHLALKLAAGFTAVATLSGGYLALAQSDENTGAPVSINDDAALIEYRVRSGDTSVNAIGERLCGAALRSQMGAQVQTLNPNLVQQLTVGEALTVPARCPGAAPTTTTTQPPVTTTTQPVTTTTQAVTTTTAAATTTTAAPTTTTTQPATTTTTVAPPAGTQFVEDFATPAGFYDRFDFGLSLHNTHLSKEGFLEDTAAQPWLMQSWNGDHNNMCSSPDQLREVHLHPGLGPVTPEQVATQTGKSQLFWWCAPGDEATRGHVMTGTNGEGYQIAWFSPKQEFTNVSRVCWDQNTTDMDSKWTNVVIAPMVDVQRSQTWKGYLDLGFDPPGFQPEFAQTSFGVVMPASPSSGPTTDNWAPAGVGVKVLNGNLSPFAGSTFLGGEEMDQWYVNDDKATRYRHCLIDNGNGTITATQDRPAQCNIRNGGMTSCGHRERTVAGAFPDGQVRVSFEDDMYDPPKRGGYDPTAITWHWDNIEIR